MIGSIFKQTCKKRQMEHPCLIGKALYTHSMSPDVRAVSRWLSVQSKEHGNWTIRQYTLAKDSCCMRNIS